MGRKSSRALRSTLLVSMDVIPFLEASLEHCLSSCPSCRSCSWLSCACECLDSIFILVCPARMFSVATVVSGLMLCRRSRSPLADALPRGLWRMLCRHCHLLFADALPRGLWQMLCRHSRSTLADALPRGLWRMLCRLCRFSLLGGCFATAALSPQLAVLSIVILCRSSRLGCGGGPLPTMFLFLVYFVLNYFLCGSCVVLWVLP
jgi:hypothetical protein